MSDTIEHSRRQFAASDEEIGRIVGALRSAANQDRYLARQARRDFESGKYPRARSTFADWLETQADIALALATRLQMEG